MRFGPTELIVILVIVLLIFGPSRLPDLGKAIGRTIQGFRSATREDESDSQEKTKENKNGKNA